MLTQFIIKGECSCIKVNLAGRVTLSPVRRDNNCSASFSLRRRKSEKIDIESELVLPLKSELNFKPSRGGQRLKSPGNNCSQRRRKKKLEKVNAEAESERELVLARKNSSILKQAKEEKR